MLPDPWDYNPLERYENATNELRQIGQEQQKVGTRIMTALWSVWQFRLYQIVGEYNTFEEYVDAELEASYDRRDYLMDFVFVTERVFDWLHKNVVLHPVTQQRITVEAVIDAPKMIGKLVRMSQVWLLSTDELRQQFITLALTPGVTRDDINDLYNDIIDGKAGRTYPVWEEVRAEGRTVFHIYAENAEIASLVRTALGRSAKIQQSDPQPW